MLFFSRDLKYIYEPWWNRSNWNRVECGLLILLNIGTQTAIYYVTTPQIPTDDSLLNSSNSTIAMQNSTATMPSNCTQLLGAQPSGWDAYAPVVVPLIAGAVNIVFFNLFEMRVTNELQRHFTEQILSGKTAKGSNAGNCKNIALIQIFSAPQLNIADMESLCKNIEDAAAYCSLMGELVNFFPMALFSRMAYLSLPQAHAVFGIAMGATATACILQSYIFGLMTASEITMRAKDNSFQTRISRDIRNYAALIAGKLQHAEETVLLRYLNEKNVESFRFTRSLALAQIINNLMYLGLSIITLVSVSQQFPQLRGTQGLINFSFAMNLLAMTFLRIIYAFGNSYPKAKAALNKIALLCDLLRGIEELALNPLLKFNFAKNLDPDVAVQFKDFCVAIPAKEDDVSKKIIDKKPKLSCFSSKSACISSYFNSSVPTKYKTPREKIIETMRAENTTFLSLQGSFSFKKGSVIRILADSGTGKSKLFETLERFWPHATGQVDLACTEDEIYSMSQGQLLIEGTLMENIYNPRPVPKHFIINDVTSNGKREVEYDLATSEEARRLCLIMRNIGLATEIERLKEVKDWGGIQDLSPGMQKRIRLLGLFMQATSPSGPKPKVIMFDEATSSVDPKNSYFVESYIMELHRLFQDALIFYIKHDTNVDPKLFSLEQQERIANNPDLFVGLDNICKEIKLERNASHIVSFDELDLLGKEPIEQNKHGLFFNRSKHASIKQSYNRVVPEDEKVDEPEELDVVSRKLNHLV